MNCELPDACGNYEREGKLIESQRKSEDKARVTRILERDRILIVACVLMILLMNIPYGSYILYPFKIFSTWIHEMCHGTAAILVGGRIGQLEIYPDGSGLAWTYTTGEEWKRGFVASAGYTGTAFWGCILLLFRRTTLGPTIGTIALGAALLLSCALYVRNTFGLIVLPIEGLVLVLCGWKLKATWVDKLYAFLAATSSLNAVESIHDLFGSSQGYVNGEIMNSDAHTVADYWGLTFQFWATLWFIFALVMSAIGLLCARDARQVSTKAGDSSTVPQSQQFHQSSQQQAEPPAYYVQVV